jgi:sodium/hydrogen antiporter
MSGVALLAGLIALYAALARRLDRWSITAAIVFTAAGVFLGVRALDVLPLALNAESTKLLAELTLGVLLFADAATVDARAARRGAALTARLLLVGLPLTIVLGTIVGALLFPSAGWAVAALLATILAPTDAALGMAVFTNRAVPARVRLALNVESGLNDGIATPLVAFFLALVASEEDAGTHHWIREALGEIAIGVGVGVAVGLVGGRLLVAARRWGGTKPTSEQVGVLALALLAFAGADALGGNGFVAAFLGGLALGAATRGALHEQLEFTETTGQVLTMAVWTLFGALLAAPALLDGLEWQPVMYAVLSLTVVRMLPVAFGLVGVGMRRETVLFMGWFGPRGLASVVFTLLAVITLEGHGDAAHTIALAATWTVLLSVVAHGLTAGPLGRLYGERIRRAGPAAEEMKDVPEPRERQRVLGQSRARPD